MSDHLLQVMGSPALGVSKKLVDMGDGSHAERVVSQTPSLSYLPAEGSPFTLLTTWCKVATVTPETKALLISSVTGASDFDIEWTVVPVDDDAPDIAHGLAVGFDYNFPTGLPLGDVYLKSASLQQASVMVGV